MDHCAELVQEFHEVPLLKMLYGGETESAKLDETGNAQVALFAVEYALSELWRSWGIKPAVVLGHSVGEYVAGCVAGVFNVEDGIRLVGARGRLMQGLPRTGAMAAVFAGEEKVREALQGHADKVVVA